MYTIDSITEEGNTCNIGDIKEGDPTYYTDSIKEEEGSPYIKESFTCDRSGVKEEGVSQNMDNIGEKYTCDSIVIKEEPDSPNMENIRDNDTYDSIVSKEDTYDHMNDINEEGISQNMDNITENITCDNIDIKEEPESPNSNMDNIRESSTYDSFGSAEEDIYNDMTDLSEKGISQNMEDRVTENNMCDNTDIKEEPKSANMDSTEESFSGDSIDIKEEDAYDYVNDMREEGITYNHNGIEQQEHNETKGAEKPGNLFVM